MAWEPLAMALLLAVMGAWALWAAFSHSDADLKPVRRRRPRTLGDMFAGAFPGTYTVGVRVLLFIGAILLGLGTAYCIHLAFRG